MPNAETGARRVRESGHNYTSTGYGDKWIGWRRRFAKPGERVFMYARIRSRVR